MEDQNQQGGGIPAPRSADDELRQAQTRRVLVGVMFVVAGVVLILNRASVFEVFGLWPLLLIGLGLSRIVGACCGNRRRSGFWLLGIGGWFALNEFTPLGYHHTWPLLLVIVGALIMWDAVAPGSRCAACAGGHHAS